MYKTDQAVLQGGMVGWKKRVNNTTTVNPAATKQRITFGSFRSNPTESRMLPMIATADVEEAMDISIPTITNVDVDKDKILPLMGTKIPRVVPCMTSVTTTMVNTTVIPVTPSSPLRSRIPLMSSSSTLSPSYSTTMVVYSPPLMSTICGVDKTSSMELIARMRAGSSILQSTAARYDKTEGTFSAFLNVIGMVDYVLSDGLPDYNKFTYSLDTHQQTILLINYGETLHQTGVDVSAVFSGLRNCFKKNILDPPVFLCSILADCKKSWAKSYAEVEDTKDKSLKLGIPEEMMREHIEVHKFLSEVIRAEPNNHAVIVLYLTSAALLFLYDRGKRSGTVVHTHPRVVSSKSSNSSESIERRGKVIPYHTIQAGHVTLMSTGSDGGVYDPISYRLAFLNSKRSGTPPPDIRYMSFRFPTDKTPGGRVSIYRRTVSGLPHGSELEDWFMDEMMEVCILGNHLNLDNTNFFSYSRTDHFATNQQRAPHLPQTPHRKMITGKELSDMLKDRAAKFGIPWQHISPHCLRHTFKTLQDMFLHSIGAPTAARMNIIAGEWVAESVSADVIYSSPTYLGHSSLRMLSQNVSYLTLDDVLLMIPHQSALDSSPIHSSPEHMVMSKGTMIIENLLSKRGRVLSILPPGYVNK